MMQYTYPDGSTSPTKPYDGQRFYQYDTYGNVLSIHQYDNMLGTWSDITNRNTQYGAYHGGYPTSYHGADEMMNNTYVNSKKCECGAKKAGSPGHSYWCDLFERNL